MNNPILSFLIAIFGAISILILSALLFCNGWGCNPLMGFVSIPFSFMWFIVFIVIGFRKKLKNIEYSKTLNRSSSILGLIALNRSINNKNPNIISSKANNSYTYSDVHSDVVHLDDVHSDSDDVHSDEQRMFEDTDIIMVKSKTNICIRVLLIVGIVGAINFCRTLSSQFWPQISFIMILLGLLGWVLWLGKCCFDFLRSRKNGGPMSHDKEITVQPAYHVILATGFLLGFLMSFLVLWSSSF